MGDRYASEICVVMTDTGVVTSLGPGPWTY